MSESTPSPTPESTRWYYAQEGASIGPMSLAAIQALWNAGELPADTLVVKEGMEDWQPLADVLGEVSKPTTPPALPPESSAPETISSVAESVKEKPDTKQAQPPPNNKEAMKGCGILVLLVIAAVILWHYWRPLLYLAGFFGTWFAVASSSLRAKRSKVLSIGGGFIMACLALIALSAVFGPSAPSTDNSTAMNGEDEGSDTEQFEPATAYSPPEVNPRSKEELLTLFNELQGFRESPEFHDYGFSRLGKIAWMNRVKQLQERETQADDSITNYMLGAVEYLESLGLSYLRSKGQETDSTRLEREAIEDRTGAFQVVTKRRLSDFERTLSGKDETMIGGVSVTNLGDVIAETMGESINWMLTERVLISSDTLDVKLVSFDDGFLYYVTRDSKGRSIPFALRRTPDIEGMSVSGYATPRERYEALVRGDGTSVDPLKTGYILVTSGLAVFDFSKDKSILNSYMSATHNKVLKRSGGVEVCRVRVINAE